MFVRNRSGLDVVLAHGQLTDELAVASLNLEMRYALGGDGRVAPAQQAERAPTDPPDICRLPLWRGVSVTAFGRVPGSPAPPHLRLVELRVGEHLERLLVHGPRVWQRRWGREPEPSEPGPFDALPLGWEHAFGGEYDLPPGPDPTTNLPHPGGRVRFVYNPRGMGFYPNAEAAVDRSLPAIERADALIHSWHDQPRPAGLAPCRDLVALRIDPSLVAEMTSGSLERYVRGSLLAALRAGHHAPGQLIFDSLPAGTPIGTTNLGLGAPALNFSLPSSPIEVHSRRGREASLLPAVARSVHLDADARTLRVVFGHPLRYPTSSPPEWFEVTVRGAA